MESNESNDSYRSLLSRSVQVTAEACAAWSSGDWCRGANLILQAADLEDEAMRSGGGQVHPAA